MPAHSPPRCGPRRYEVVAANEAVENLGKEPAFLRPDAAHDAEIHGDKAALAVDEEVSLMHVGMEKAVAQCVAQEGLHHNRRERG
jgi:hypothetical protein